jgi:calnexin
VRLALVFSVLAVAVGKSGILFSESFDEGDVFASGKWTKSSDEKYAGQPVMVKASDKAAKGFSGDKGLSLTQEMKFYGLSAEFPEIVHNKGKDFVVQYELKLEEGLSCGGAYVKLPRAGDAGDLSELTNETPYTIMFGPDRCGTSNDKVHFIMQHQNPISKEWEEKHLTRTPTVFVDSATHLYTLEVRSDNTFSIYIDKDRTESGHLLEDMNPPVNPSEEIDDPTDFKPEDWVDEAKIPDPEASKPDDWDEDLPAMIDDLDSTKPDGWLDDEPEMIPDPDVVKPDDWDDEEDGEYEAPLIDNPACDEAGCGEWKPKKIPNPDYKGKWTAPLIDNPAYKGEWKAKQIANPNYFFDERPADMAPMSGIAVEVWTTNAGIHFDNFVVADNLDAAFAYAEETFVPKRAAEDEAREAAEKASRNSAIQSLKESGDVLKFAEALLAQAYNFCQDNYMPVLVTVGVLLASLIAYVLMDAPAAPVSEEEESETSTTRGGKSRRAAAKKPEPEEVSEEEEEEEGEEEEEEEEVEESEEEKPAPKPSATRRSPRRRG